MLTATVMRRLEALSEISQQGKRINGLFRLLENPILWYEAYANIYANKGAITPGVDKQTLDGFSEERVTSIMTPQKRNLPISTGAPNLRTEEKRQKAPTRYLLWG